MEIIKNYWPFLAMGLWFGYKWWNSKKIIAMLPELKKQGAVFVDVRSSGEFASANAPKRRPKSLDPRTWSPSRPPFLT